MSLTRKTVSGFLWTAGNQFSTQLINFIVLVILSRILSPGAFGLLAMLQVFIAIGTSLMDSGMTSSLIRTTDADNADYSSVFFINVISSVFIYVVLFFSAPLIASFYQQPSLVAIVRVFTLTFIIQALVGVQSAKLSKEMNFKLQLFMQLPATIIGSAAGILLAYLGYGVWSLVYLNLVRAFVFMIQHWLLTDWRPVLVFDIKKIKQHFSFGYKLTLIGILHSTYNNIYNIIIGRMLTPVQVGFYNQANTFSIFPVDIVSTALDKVTYPMFAHIQDEKEKLKIAYRKIMQQVVYWTVPLMMVLIIVAAPLFRIMLGNAWAPAVPYFQIICIYSIMHPLQVYNINILKVKGRSDLMLKLELIKKTLGIVGAIGIGYWGIYPLLWFKAFYAIVLFYINTRYSGKMLDYSIRQQIRDIYPMYLLGGLILAICWAADHFFFSVYISDWLRIIVTGSLFLFLYLLAGYMIRITALFDLAAIISQHKKLAPLVPSFLKKDTEAAGTLYERKIKD